MTTENPSPLPTYRDVGLGEDFAELVEQRRVYANTVAEHLEVIAGIDSAILSQLGSRPGVRAGTQTFSQVAPGITRRLDRTKLMKLGVDAGIVAAAMVEVPRKGYLLVRDIAQDLEEDTPRDAR